jgi:hypothetical protein
MQKGIRVQKKSKEGNGWLGSIQRKRYLKIGLVSLVISLVLGPIATYFTISTHPLEYPRETPMFVEYWGFPFAWLKQTIWDWPGPENEIIWSGFALDTLFWTLALFAPITILSVVVIPFFTKKERCPVCGSKSIERILEKGIAVRFLFIGKYKCRCRKCLHEWEGYGLLG